MSDGDPGSASDCPSGLWPREEADSERWTAAINRAETARDKAEPARALMEISERLLDCADRDAGLECCSTCQQLAQVRYRTASLVARVGQLGDS